MSGFAVIGLNDAYFSSLGIFLDAFELVRRQVSAMYRTHAPIAMQTPVQVLTLDGKPIHLAGNRTLPADAPLDTQQQYDLIYLPSFLVGSDDALAERLTELAPLCHWLQRQHEGGARIAASGSAVFILAEAGFLHGAQATLARPLVPLFRRRYPSVRLNQQKPLVEHGRIISAGGLAAGAQLMSRLIEQVTTAEMSRWYSDVISLHHVSEAHLADDALTANAQLWIEERFAQDVRIEELAQAMAVSQQTLLRHFHKHLNTTPQQYVRQLRIRSAQSHLTRTSRSIEHIASLSGYSDVHSFRKVFRELTGMSPSQFRNQAQQQKHALADQKAAIDR